MGFQNLDDESDTVKVGGGGNVSPGFSSRTTIFPGALLDNRYKVLSELGRGGMGVVFKVEHAFLRDILAIKLLSTNFSESDALRFQKEGKACRLLDHPNVIKVTDFALLEDGTPYMVMEYVDGISLTDVLRQRASLEQGEAIELFCHILDGLNYAHSRGVIHRDLKPSNIMLVNGDLNAVKIVDFGIAKVLSESNEQTLGLTQSGDVFGSPLYMSPEQSMGQKVDARSDLYSLGCSLAQVLTGAPPFSGDSALATIIMHQNAPVPTLRDLSIGKQFDENLERVVAKALSKSRDERYQSALDFKNDLEAVRDKRPLSWYVPTAIEKGSKPTSQTLLKAVLGALLLVGIGWAVARQISPAPQSATPEASVPPPAEVKTDTGAVQGDVEIETDKEPFAPVSIKEWKPGSPWILKFDSKERLGSVGQRGVRQYPADGAVEFAKAAPLSFFPTYEGLRPQTLKRFRPDEIYKLELKENDNVDDTVMKEFARFTSLEEFRAEGTPITNKGILALNDLPKLENVSLSHTGVTGDGIGATSFVRRLTTLEADGIVNARGMLRSIAGSPKLKVLDLRDDYLKDDDLVIIGKLPALKHLRMRDSQDITDKGIANLVNIDHLLRLDVSHNPLITSASTKYFGKLPDASVLTISADKWSAEDLRTLKETLRSHGVRVDFKH